MNTIDNMLYRFAKNWLTCFLLLLLCIPAQATERPSPEALFSVDLYSELTADNLTNIAAVSTNYDEGSAVVSSLLMPEIASLVFSSGAGAPFQASAFPTNFVNQLIPQTNLGVVTYPIVMYEDDASKQAIFNVQTQSVGYVDTSGVYHVDVQTYAPTGAVMTLDLLSPENAVKLTWVLGKTGVEPLAKSYAPSGPVSRLRIEGVDMTNITNLVYISYPTSPGNDFRTYCTSLVVFTRSSLTNGSWSTCGVVAVNQSTNWVCLTNAPITLPRTTMWYKVWNPQAVDTDGDGFTDAEEAQGGSDPANNTSTPSAVVYVSVTNGNDTNSGIYTSPFASISKGIGVATSGVRVVVMPGTYTGSLNRALDFKGTNRVVAGLVNRHDDTIIDCGGVGRAFYFHSSETTNAIVRYLTIKNGYHVDKGGGIYCSTNAKPVIVNCRVTQCVSSNNGGGIYADDTAYPRIQNCTISSNTSVDKGGGVFLSETSIVANCTISANAASGLGGGVYLKLAGIITNCTISANTSDEGGGVYLKAGGAINSSAINQNMSSDQGGGVYVEAGGTIISCTVSNNESDTKSGGGVYLHVGGTITNCTVIDNSASDHGGGVYLRSGGTIIASTISLNHADFNGGGIFAATSGTITACLVSSNSADIHGGGIYCTNFSPVISGCWVTGCDADTNGGGIYLESGGTISSCNISSNNSNNDGGGIYLKSGGTINASTVSVNEADFNGGGIFVATSGTITNCTVDDNSANYNGGGIYCTDSSPFILSTWVTGCDADTNGGGIYCASGTVPTIRQCTITTNNADQNGGGVYLQVGGTLTNCTITGNTADESGGGIYLRAGGRLYGCIVQGNQAFSRDDYTGGGGVILVNGGAVVSSTVKGNWAYFGGGIYCAANAGVTNCMVSGNQADNRGGGIYIYTDNNKVVNCTIVGNDSFETGGGVGCGGSGTVLNSIIYSNTAVLGANYFNAQPNLLPSAYNYCCMTPPTNGTGNITNSPLLVSLSNPHLVSSSPCINAGNNTYASGVDIDGTNRIVGTVDIGCDEYVSGSVTGVLQVAMFADATNAVVGYPLNFTANITGLVSNFAWRVVITNGAGSSVTSVVPNTLTVTQSWAVTGQYNVALWATNSTGPAAVTVKVNVATSFTNYVSPSGLNTSPYTNWTMAATSIQSAIDAGYVGGLVMVTNGTYYDEVRIAKAITLRSVNGYSNTIIDGNNDHRCIALANPNAVVDGFTITRGFSNAETNQRGGGVNILGGGLLINSVLATNHAGRDGGGAFIHGGGTVSNCQFIGNMADGDGGGMRIDFGGNSFSNLIVGNTAGDRGGGVHLHRFGLISNCVIRGNAQTNEGGTGGGIGFTHGWSDAVITWCSISNNTTLGDGGGVYLDSQLLTDDGTFRGRPQLLNSMIMGNSAISNNSDGGGVRLRDDGIMKNCLVAGNTAAKNGGGILVDDNAIVLNCTVTGNSATNGGGIFFNTDLCTNQNTIVYLNTATNGANWWPTNTAASNLYCCMTPIAGGISNTNSNPLFLSSDDYHLSSTSPCVNRGSSSFLPTNYFPTGDLDLDGSLRTNGVIDIGAYEYH